MVLYDDFFSKRRRSDHSTCCHGLGRTGGVAAAGLAEGVHGDVVGGAAAQGRQRAGRGRVPAQHHGAAAGRSGLVQVRASHRGPGDPHRVAGREHGPELTGTTRSCEQKRQTGKPEWEWKTAAKKSLVSFIYVLHVFSKGDQHCANRLMNH